MTSKPKSKPKLDRRNAAKNIKYDYTSASSSLEEYGKKTSFRIDGSVEGEVELLCKTLGFSGIEDFAIPQEEYAAAMKLRTSSAPLLNRDICDSLCINNNNNNNRGSISNGIKGVKPPPLVEKEYSISDSDLDLDLYSVDGNDKHSFGSSSNDDSSTTTTTTPMSSDYSPNRRIIVDWQKGDLLGRGSFGSVYEGISLDGFFFAVKEVSLLDQDNEGKQRILQLEQEISLLSRFEHENIVQYYGTEKDESRLYIFLELVTQGSLLSLYQKYNLRDPQVSAYTRQILHGLKYLHDKDVVHRDIKCANILVDTKGLVKLADFGLAKATKLNDVKSCKGTPFWMAPEVVRSLGYGLPADIWSLGCSVLEMLTRSFPYSNLEPMAALFKIGRGERPPIPDSLSRDAQDFIQNCLQVDPNLRPTAAQLLDHPFVKRPLPQTSGLASPRILADRID